MHESAVTPSLKCYQNRTTTLYHEWSSISNSSSVITARFWHSCAIVLSPRCLPATSMSAYSNHSQSVLPLASSHARLNFRADRSSSDDLSSHSSRISTPLTPDSNSNLNVASSPTAAGLDSLTESELYVRLMLPSKHGYPVWRPRISRNLPVQYQHEGVQVGDVMFGDFDGFNYLFNAFHPKDDPINAQRTPPNFTPMSSSPTGDIQVTRNSRHIFNPGSHIASNGSNVQKYVVPPPCTFQYWTSKVPRQVGGGLKYSSSSSKGALLILPEGATRIDLRHNFPTSVPFYTYIAQFARSWYEWVNINLGLGVHSSSLYLITGCDKTRAYGAACTADPSDTWELEFKPILSQIFRSTPRYTFPTVSYAATSVGSDDVHKRETLCLFLRGYKIAVREDNSSAFGLDDDEAEYEVKASHMPGIDGVYHPSNEINRWILRTYKEVDVAITHDDDWAFVIQDGEEEIPAEETLIGRMSQYVQIVKVDGLTYGRFVLPL
ncbi:hypothetical protein D9757_006699 [Collybiopsis confluens]|uniref:Uncharacterized protein n=1 Tax=Collybiopsis confluens TaxID=2823264 RepID=A0A8H5HN35_9AGAR|nr:hypothetical protein D9757_006699 [Collybiopsis confluens]